QGFDHIGVWPSMRNLIAADDLVDKAIAVVPAKPVKNGVGDAPGKAGIESDLDPLLLERGKDLFCMGKWRQLLVVAVGGDHLVDEAGVDAIDQHLVVLTRRGKLFEQQRDGIHLTEAHYFFHLGDRHFESEVPKGSNKGFCDAAVILYGGAGDVEYNQLDR